MEPTKKIHDVETLVIPHQPNLDQITVYWHNYEPGKGMVTIVCFAAAWNCYFGGMSDDTIEQFFASAGVDYLTNKLIDRQWQKPLKRHEQYLARIITAIKKELRMPK